MLSVDYAECRKSTLSAECHFAECHYAECRGAITWAVLTFHSRDATITCRLIDIRLIDFRPNGIVLKSQVNHA
jgi:hypothetical protein